MTWTEADIPDQRGRVAVVTGANSGIGFETARALAEKGAEVVLGCRDAARGRDAFQRILQAHPDASVSLMTLDLSSLDSVRSFAAEIAEVHERVHVLVNNAGVMATPLRRTAEGFELQFGTNHLGHFALTGLLIDRITATESARIVSVSSLGHRIGRMDFNNLDASKGYRRWRVYGTTKLANLLFTYELQRRLRAAGHDTLAVASHPGWTATNLQRTTWSARLFNPILGMSPAQGAGPSLCAATAPDVTAASYWGPDGLMEMRGAPRRVESNARSHDEAAAKRLWEVSEELTGVRYL